MKTLYLILAFTLCTACAHSEKDQFALNTSTQNQENVVKRYDVPSGIVIYKTSVSGNTFGMETKASGTVELYFTKYGALELIETKSTTTTTSTVNGRKISDTTSEHSINKLDNETSYYVDFDRQEIYKNKDMAMGLINQMESNQDAGKVGQSMLEAIGGEKIGEEFYKGYDCEVWESMGVKQWLYKGVLLKSTASLMGITSTQEATHIEFDINVPDKYFKLPDYPMAQSPVGAMGDLEDMDMDDDYGDMQEGIQRMKNISYEEWKNLVLENDEEMQGMSEEELRQAYNYMQNMIKQME